MVDNIYVCFPHPVVCCPIIIRTTHDGTKTILSGKFITIRLVVRIDYKYAFKVFS